MEGYAKQIKKYAVPWNMLTNDHGTGVFNSLQLRGTSTVIATPEMG